MGTELGLVEGNLLLIAVYLVALLGTYWHWDKKTDQTAHRFDQGESLGWKYKGDREIALLEHWALMECFRNHPLFRLRVRYKWLGKEIAR